MLLYVSTLMNEEQRKKLANALYKEAYVCYRRGEKHEASELIEQSMSIQFCEIIERIANGECALLDVFMEMQYCHNKEVKAFGQLIIEILRKNETFNENYELDITPDREED